jgi:hypothetical protein
MEERLLELAMNRTLRTEDSDYSYRVTKSTFSSIDEQYYIIKTVTVDNYSFQVYVHRELKRGYLEYFYYDYTNCSDKLLKVRYNLYLSVNDVLDGKPFFTTTRAERRKIKLENIKNKLQNKELEMS